MDIRTILLLLLPSVSSGSSNHDIGGTGRVTGGYGDVRDEIVGMVASKTILARDGQESPISFRRELGDFDDLNDLFDGLVLGLPDLEFSAGKVLGSTVRLWASNMKCSSIAVNDIVIDYRKAGNTRFDFNVDIQGLDISCELNWKYKWSFFDGSGRAQVYTDNNNAATGLRFYSQGYDQHPPSSSSVESCNAAISISDMDFQGGIVASIMDTFEKSFRGRIADEIQDTACAELGSLGTTLVGDMLEYVEELIESYLVELPPEYKDVLNAENNMVVSEDTKLINFTDFHSTLGTDTMGSLFQAGLRFVDGALGTMMPDPQSSELDLGVNLLLRSLILNEDRALAINITDLPDYAATSGIIFEGHDMLTETTIILEEAKLFGLDTFQYFDPLNAAGQYTLENYFSWQQLRAEFSLTLIMKPSSKSDSLIEVGTDAEVRESINVSIGIDDIGVDFFLLFGVDENELGNLQLGSMLDASNILPCLVPTIFANEVTGFSANIGNMDPPALGGFISPGIDRLISKAADAVFIMYESTLLKATPNFFELTVRNVTNEAISSLVNGIKSNSTCIRFDAASIEDRLLHFGDLLLTKEDAIIQGGSGDEPYGTIARDLLSMIRKEVQVVNPVTSDLYLNEMIVSNFTSSISGTPGTINVPSDLFNSQSRLSIGELNAKFQLRVSDTRIENIDSFGLPLQLLEPTEGRVLNNAFTIGANNKPLLAKTQLTVAFSDEKEIQLRNVIDFGLEISNATVQVEALVSILESRLLQFPIEDVNNLHCWLSTIPAPALDATGVRKTDVDPTLALKELKFVMDSMKLNVECVDCSSPKFNEFTEILSSDEAIEDVTKLTNGAIQYISSLLGGSFLQVTFDRMLNDAAKQCPHRPEFEGLDFSSSQYPSFDEAETSEASLGFMVVLGSIIVAATALVMISALTVKIVRYRRHHFWLSTVCTDEIDHHKRQQLEQEEFQTLLNSETKSMFRSSAIPFYLRYFVPIAIVANLFFFLSGHLSLGASVDIDAQVGGEAIQIKELFVFSMAESVEDMWEAGAKELAILILLVSGVWPYTKTLCTMYLWFAPPRFTSVRRRESLLLWFDSLGKWSFVDIFILIMSVPSFRVVIDSPDNISFLPKDFYSLNILLIPCWGLYSNMIAQFISQFNSHLIIHYHRKIVKDFEAFKSEEKGDYETEETTDEPKQLCNHLFQRGGAKTGRPITTRSFMAKGIIALAIIFVCLLLTGALVPSFSLSQYGLVGLAVEASPNESTYNKHNVISTVQLLMAQASFTGMTKDIIGLTTLSATFVITVIVVPIVQMAFLLRRWFGNLDTKARERNFVVVETLQAWQYVEVYIVSILIACWQLGQVSEFLINDYCGSFDSLFNSLAYYGILRPIDSQCFKVQASVQEGAWILIAAALVLMIVKHIIGSAAEQQKIDIEKSSTSFAVFGYDEDDLLDVDLKPLPPLFSDRYRWLLTKTNKKLQFSPTEDSSLE